MTATNPVLASAAERPDLLSTRIHFARLEQHYAVLLVQRERAEGRCNRVAQHPDGVNEPDLLRAELFANRIESQIHRALKELRKTERELKKALEDSPLPASLKIADVARKPPEVAADANSARPHESATPSTANVELTLHNDSRPKSSPHAPDELKNVVARHRNRILSTPAENRPALIARLIEENRAKNPQNTPPQDPNRPKPSQNGKHAA